MSTVTVTGSERFLELVLESSGPGATIDHEFVDTCLAALETREERHRCVALRASGANFCFGGDVRSFTSGDVGVQVRGLADRFHEVIRALAAIDVPVLMAAQGWVTGAGIGLACAADILLVGPETRFRSAYHALGLTGDGGVTWTLPRRIGSPAALDLLLTDRTIDGEEAVRLGLASRLVATEELPVVLLELAAAITRQPRATSTSIKRLVLAGQDRTLEEQLEDEARTIGDLAGSQDGQEGITAFLERRTPRFA